MAFEQLVIMVAARAGMNLHHHAVLDAHRGEFGQHLGAEQLGIGRRPAPADDLREQRLGLGRRQVGRSEEHTSELQSLMRSSYSVFCLKKQIKHKYKNKLNDT